MKTSLIALLVALFTAPAQAAEWNLPPIGYSFQKPVECPLKGEEKLIYPACNDQMEKFAQAMQRAKASGKLLLVSFGATWCPYTKKHHSRLHSDILHRAEAAPFVLVEIAGSSSAVDASGKPFKFYPASGSAVLDIIFKALPQVPERLGFPSRFVLDPNDASVGVSDEQFQKEFRIKNEAAFDYELDFLRWSHGKLKGQRN